MLPITPFRISAPVLNVHLVEKALRAAHRTEQHAFAARLSLAMNMDQAYGEAADGNFRCVFLDTEMAVDAIASHKQGKAQRRGPQ